MSTTQGGQKGRKIGRALRKPAHNRYNSEKRWEANKERKRVKQAKKEAKNNGIISGTV